MPIKKNGLKKPERSEPAGSEENPEAILSAEIVAAVLDAKREAEEDKTDRLIKNKSNWDMYHGRGNFRHKIKGQSKEFLHKSALAAEQITALFKSVLTSFDKWIDVEWTGTDEDPIFTAHLAKTLLRLYLGWANVRTVVSDGVKVGVHEGLVTIKLTGEHVTVPRYISTNGKLFKEDKLEWRLVLTVIPAEDFNPDPHSNLYIDHQILQDRFRLLERSSEGGKDTDRPYVLEEVSQLNAYERQELEQSKARNRGRTTHKPRMSRRRPVLVDEFWGTVLDREGRIMVLPPSDRYPKGMVLQNVLLAVGNESALIRWPEQNPRWAATPPFVSAPLLRVPFSRWSKAIMDAASALNVTINELFNLMLDGGLSAVHGIKQIREDYMEDPGQASEGVPPGTTLKAAAHTPVGMKILERIDTGDVPPDVLAFFNIVTSLFAENALTNEIRLGGLPSKQVRATEVVQASQSISGIFDGLADDFDDVFIEPLAQQAWLDILQNVDQFPQDDLVRLLGKEVVDQLNALSPAERFERAARGFKFIGKGLRSVMQRQRDLQRMTTFLQIIGSNEMMLQELNRRFSVPKILSKIMLALEIDPEDVQLSPSEQAFREKVQLIQEQAMAAMRAGVGGEVPPGAGPGRTPPNSSEPGNSAEQEMEPGSGAGEAGSPTGGFDIQ